MVEVNSLSDCFIFIIVYATSFVIGSLLTELVFKSILKIKDKLIHREG